MEVAGVALGAVGLLALYKEAASKVHSVTNFSSETLRLTSRYNATKILFERWGKQVGIADNDDLVTAVHPHLSDSATAAVVASLLNSIHDVFATTSSTIATYSDLNPTGPAANQSGSSRLGMKSRLKWAAADNGKLSRQIQDFELLVQRLYLLVPLESLQPDQFQKLQDALVESQRSHALSRMLRWLDAGSTEDIFDAYCIARLETTCRWIVTHPTYIDWLSDHSTELSKVLWIHGPAGFGKSVLCAHVIQLLRGTGRFPVYYFFCSTENELQRDPSSILRLWIFQAICQDDSVLETASQYLSSCEKTRATYSDLQHLLQQILSLIPESVFVVDGLDECPRSGTSRINLHHSRADILHEMMDLIAGSKSRLLVVSRDEGDIKAELGLHAPTRPGLVLYELSITRDLVAPDVSQFAEHVVTKKLPGKSDGFQQELAAQMAGKCDGMFLLIRLQSRNLRPLKGNKQLQRVVNEMPTELVQVYERSWTDIQGFSSTDKQRAETILRWVTFAQRPLTIAEISEAVAVLDNEEDDGPQFDELPDQFSQSYVDSEILGLCGCFLELRSTSTASSWEYQTVHLIHFSAVEFLAGQQATGPFSDLMLQNYYLALGCLEYLDHEVSWIVGDDEGHNIIYKRPFSTYAISSWYEHLIRSQQYQDKIQPQLKSFFRVPNSNWDNWRQRYEAGQATPSASSASESDDAPLNPPSGGRMYYAALFGLLELAEHLHEMGMASIDDTGGFYGNPVQAASSQGNLDVLEFLLNMGADINPHGLCGSALHAAAQYNQEKAATKLLQHGASISATDNEGRTPIYAAASSGSHATAQLLINAGKNYSSVSDRAGYTPLHLAVRLGDIEMVKILLRNGADFSLANEEGNTPLHLSAWHGHTEIFKLLLDEGADVKSTNLHGITALYYAAFDGHVQICKSLLDVGADPTVADQSGVTALHTAAEGGDSSGVISLLLDSGADPDACTIDGITPLCTAARHGHCEVVKILLQRGSGPTVYDNHERTPLHFAANHGHYKVAETLLSFGPDVAARDEFGNTPLHCAAYSGCQKLVKLLLGYGADISAADVGKWTALYSASLKGHAGVVQLLIESGAEVDSRADDGTTPLHIAFRNRQENAIRVLLDNQASIDCIDHYGLAPWQYASKAFREQLPHFTDCENTTKCFQEEQRVRKSFLNIAERVRPLELKNYVALSRLSECLNRLGDFASASVVDSQNFRIKEDTGEATYNSICDSCKSWIYGRGQKCTTCSDYDLCDFCMNRYAKGGASFGDCAGHEFYAYTSEDWNRNELTNLYSEGFVEWLKELESRYRREDL